MKVQPLYTSTCNAAYQLRWTLALYPSHPLPQADIWLERLRSVTERDDVRILEYHPVPESDAVQFLISSLPTVKPPAIVKSIKGRLQHTLAVSYMNNVAFKHGMLRMWMGSYYVGTIGAYDMGAVRRVAAH